MWLGEQITARGIGNGISLIIFTGIIAQLPSALASTLELGRTGAISSFLIIFLLAMSVAVIAFIVFMERAQRRILVQYPKRQQGNRMFRRRKLAPAAQDQRLRRDPPDLCQFSPVDAGDTRQLWREQEDRNGWHRSPHCWDAVSRCSF